MSSFAECMFVSKYPSKEKITQNAHNFNSLVWNFGSGSGSGTAAVHYKRRTGVFTPLFSAPSP